MNRISLRQEKVSVVAILLLAIGTWEARTKSPLATEFFDVESIRKTFPGALENIDAYLKENHNVDLNDPNYFSIEESGAIREAIKAVAESISAPSLQNACRQCERISESLDNSILVASE